MSTKIIKTIFRFRRDTSANWALNSTVVPAEGEPCFDIDAKTLRIGDGITQYGSLIPIGGVNINADGNAIILEDDTFKLFGFESADIGAQPRKNADGKLEWVVPSTETVEGLQTTITAMQTDLNNLKESVSGIDAKIDAKINEFATKVTDDGVVNNYKELIDYVAQHGSEAAEMASQIAALQTDVNNIKSEGPSGKIENIKLGNDVLEIADKTVTIPIGAGLTASSEITISETNNLGLGNVGVSKLVNEDGIDLVLDGGNAN